MTATTMSFDIEEFLLTSVPSNILKEVAICDKVTYFGEGNKPQDFLPEKGPFVFFQNRPVAIGIKSNGIDLILGSMLVEADFCVGHFYGIDQKFQPRLALPLYFIGGAAGQLCAIYTTFSKKDDRFIALAKSGSANSLAKSLIDVGTTLLFVIRVESVEKHGVEFSYEVFHQSIIVANGQVGSITVPMISMFKKLF